MNQEEEERPLDNWVPRRWLRDPPTVWSPNLPTRGAFWEQARNWREPDCWADCDRCGWSTRAMTVHIADLMLAYHRGKTCRGTPGSWRTA